MVKCTRKYKKSKTVKRKYSRKYTKKSGGNKHFSEQDIDYLRQVGFSQKDIEYLHRRKRNGANIPIAFIRHFIKILDILLKKSLMIWKKEKKQIMN